jgi:hypothetical protein
MRYSLAQSGQILNPFSHEQKTHMPPGEPSTIRGHYDPCIPYPQRVRSLLTFPDPTTQKMVSRLYAIHAYHFDQITGIPKSEMRSVGQPPRILSSEEQEKMRTVCRVSSDHDLPRHSNLVLYLIGNSLLGKFLISRPTLSDPVSPLTR